MVVILVVAVALSILAEGISASCSSDEFPCNDGSCINRSMWCNREKNCKDGTDEDYCLMSTLKFNPNGCDIDFFLCHDGSCIPFVGRCDGFSSCKDNSDEENCSTSEKVLSTENKSAKMMHSTTTHQPQITPHLFISAPYSPTVTSQHDADINATEHNIQSDSGVNETKENKLVSIDLTKGFREVNKNDFIHEKEMAEAWFFAARDNAYGWGDETARAITALYLSKEDLMKKSNTESKMMIKELHLKISVALVRNQTKEMPLIELASFINALLATCGNPRNFYGHDLVDALRHRANFAHVTESISPLIYLTLCITHSNTYEDMRKLIDEAGRIDAEKIDVLALMSLAATCMSSTTGYSAYYHVGPQITRQLHDIVTSRGLPENIYGLSLVVQALNEGKINQDRWNRSDALHHFYILQQDNGSFGDILSTYFALPVLSGTSLIALARHCHPENEKDMVTAHVLKNGNEEKHYISYSLHFSEPVEVVYTLRLNVGMSTNFLDIMRMAESTNPMYRFRFDIALGKPLVYSIGGIANDAEQGLYWNMYRSTHNSTRSENLQPYHGDIRSFIPTVKDHVVFRMEKLYK